MASVKKFEELEAWKLSRELHAKIGKKIDAGSFRNNYRLIGQIEGSSGSIMDNIAEGFERGSRKEFIVFLAYSKGSCGELRSQLYRSLDRNYISQDYFDETIIMLKRISAMLQSLITYLKKSPIEGTRKQ